MPNGNSDTFSWFRPLHYHRIPISNFKIGIPSNFLIGEQIRIWPFPKHFLKISYHIWKNPVFLANQNSMCSYLTVKFWVVGFFDVSFSHLDSPEDFLFALLWQIWKFWASIQILSLFFRNLNLVAKKFMCEKNNC